MSLDASQWAWKQRCGKSSAKLVLLSLADRAGSDNCAFPSVETLQCDTELNEKTIRAAIKHLIEIGLIEDSGSRKGPTQQVKVYHLIGVENRHSRLPKTDTLEPNETLPKTDTFNGEKSSERLPKTDGFKDTQKRKPTKNGSLPILPLKTTNFTVEDTQNWVAEPVRNSKEPLTTTTTTAGVNDFTHSQKIERPDFLENSFGENWIPNPVTIQRISQLGIPVEFSQSQVTEFRIYWLTSNEPPRGRNYETAFLKSVQYAWNKSQGQRGANYANPNQRTNQPDSAELHRLLTSSDESDWSTPRSPFDAADSNGSGCGGVGHGGGGGDFPEMAGAVQHARTNQSGAQRLVANLGGNGRDE